MQPCCDNKSPKSATDFFNRPCRDPAPSDINKLRCQACTGFAYDTHERSCVLVHSDWFQDQFYPEEELSSKNSSTFYVREAVLGHAAGAAGHTHHRPTVESLGDEKPHREHKHSYIRCPYLSSGYGFMTREDVSSEASRFPRQPLPGVNKKAYGQSIAKARSVISDLEMCTGTDKLWDGATFNGQPVNLPSAGRAPHDP